MLNSTSVGFLFTAWEIPSRLVECCPEALPGLFLWFNGTSDPTPPVVRQSPPRAGHWGTESRATYSLLSRVRDVHTPMGACLGMGGREKCPRCVVCPHNSWSLRTRSSAQRGLQNRCHLGCGRDESGSTGVSLACVRPRCAQPCASQWQEKERPVLDIVSHWEAEEKVTLAGEQIGCLTLACQESPLNLSSLEVIIPAF